MPIIISETMAQESEQDHNKSVLNKLVKGDLIEIKRGKYSHWAVYSGHWKVVHLTGIEGTIVPNSSRSFSVCGVNFEKAAVKEEQFWSVVGDSKADKNNKNERTNRCLKAKEIVRRARSKKGPVTYNVHWSNCERFALWCRYHTNISNEDNVNREHDALPIQILARDSELDHNKQVLAELRKGDLIEIKRWRYSHWAVYSGKRKVIHLTGIAGPSNSNSNSSHLFYICGEPFDKAIVKKEEFWSVVGNSKAEINNSKDRKYRWLTPEEIVSRAQSKIGPLPYNVLWCNCEHFASWCRYGFEISEQAEQFRTKLFVGIVVVVVTFFGRNVILYVLKGIFTYLGRLLVYGYGTGVRATCARKRQLLKQPQNATAAAVYEKIGNLYPQLKLFYDDLNVILYHGSEKWCCENIDMIEKFCKRILKDRSRGFPQEINVILRKLSICSRYVKHENKAIGFMFQFCRVYLYQKLVRTILIH